LFARPGFYHRGSQLGRGAELCIAREAGYERHPESPVLVAEVPQPRGQSTRSWFEVAGQAGVDGALDTERVHARCFASQKFIFTPARKLTGGAGKPKASE